MYLVENRLIYVTEQRGQADVDAPFFLHLYPVGVHDLPGHRKQYAIDNLDFNFDRYGLRSAGPAWRRFPRRNTASPKSGPVRTS